MNYIKILQLIFSLLPIIHQAIDHIEDLFPQGGFGAQKLAMLKSILENAMTASEVGTGVFSQVWPLLVNIVTQIVAVKNSIKNNQPGKVANTVPHIPASIRAADTARFVV